MGTTSVGIIIFICLCCWVDQCLAAAYGEACGSSDLCASDSFQACSNATCICSDGYIENSTQDGCNAGLGYTCTVGVPCHDSTFAECVRDTCICKSTHYDDNPANNAGNCIQKKSLGEDCPDPKDGVADTMSCAEVNSLCSSYGSSATGYSCQCKSQYTKQGSTCVDIDDCSSGPCKNGGSCSDVGSTFACNCTSTGYAGSTCEDVIKLDDRCSVNDDCKFIPNATCLQNFCKCKSGFYDTQPGDGGTCQKSQLGEGCTNNAHCDAVTNAECSSNFCVCRSGFYDTVVGIGGVCQKSKLGEGCSSDVHCDAVSNAKCTLNVCTCKDGYFDTKPGNGGTCRKSKLGEGCTNNAHCDDVTNAECSSSSNLCVCKSGFYDTVVGIGGVCQKSQLGEGCTNNAHCDAVTNAECSSNLCVCKSGFYDTVVGIGGVCQKSELGGVCTVNAHCNAVANSECSSKVCVCKSGFYDTVDGVGGVCQKSKLGEGCSLDVHCDAVSNAKCSSNVCTCKNGYFDTQPGQGGTCQKSQLGEGCTDNAHCNAVTNAECSGNICMCENGYYDTKPGVGGTCEKRYLNESCSASTQCSNIPNTECQGNVCKCKTGYYQDGTGSSGTCTRRYLGQKCSASSQCSLTPNTECQGTLCKCKTGYYQSGYGSTGSCTKRNLGEQCTATGQCAAMNAVCETTTCQCNKGYYQTSGTNIKCDSITNLKVSNIQFDKIQTDHMTVRWTAPAASYKQYISGYTIQWKPKYDNNVISKSADLDSNFTMYLFKEGIHPGRAYIVTIVSNTIQTFQGSTRKTPVVSEQAAKPSITSGIDLSSSESDASDGSIKIAWNASSGYVSGYIVKLLDGTTQIRQSTFSGREATFYRYQIPQLKNGYKYKVTIQAKSEEFSGRIERGEIFTGEFKTTPKKPYPPGNRICKDPTDSTITVSWTAPAIPNGDIVQYRIGVYSDNRTNLFNETSSGSQTEKKVDNLQPGTPYMFQLYTENEVGLSDASPFVSECKTKAKMSTPPTSLQVTDVTSRSFHSSWGKPVNLYSEENYGYVLQIKDGDKCVKEIIYRCSDCTTGSLEISKLSGLCTLQVRPVMDKSKQELEGQLSYTANLDPDIDYTVTVTAINDEGRGHEAIQTARTLEEVPQKPGNIQVTDITTTSLLINWTIADPRPGTTQFIVKLNAAGIAYSKEFTITGFEKRSLLADGLEEFWNYTVEVIASTRIGDNKSDLSIPYQTLPAAPGMVSDFQAISPYERNYHQMKVMWKAPLILKRNSIIKEYSFKHNTTGELQSPKTFEHNNDDNYEYSAVLDVLPEEYYSFEVFAINVEAEIGVTDTLIRQAEPGVPVNIEETMNVEIIPNNKVKNTQQTQITVSLVQDFFEQDGNGKIRATGLIACAKNCDFSGIKVLSDFTSMDNWNEASKNGFTLYRVDNNKWLEELVAVNSLNARRKRDVTYLDFTLGGEKCEKDNTEGYCNGPLQPSTKITLVAVACTNGGCLLSDEYGPFITLAVPPEKSSLGMIIGIVVAVVVLVGIGAVVGFIMIRKRRGPGKMKPASDSDDDDFTTIDPAISKIKRKRPFLLSDIEDYVNNMHKDSNLLFSSEYEDLKTLSPKHSCDAADREENRMRNRYINIIPFDHTRVKLSTNGEDDPCDYINANYLPGYTSPREYIGCQGPIPGTIDDFWRMTWEQNVSVIVMLTLCKEGQKIKCEQYWPEDVAEPKQYGDVIVEMTSYSNIRTYDYRLFKITNGSQTRVIKHFHFLSWLDFQANVHHDIILDFILQVRQHVQPPDTSGPMIVHCSAGVGRTGTYIALDHLMQFINEHDFDVQVDIFDMVLNLRENRQHMVQTEQQYVFIHDCVKEILERKRRNMENIYENEAFSQDENIYQNEQQNLYANVAASGHEQNTEL